MKPNIVFLDEYTLGGADLGRLQALGEYKGYARTTPEELPDRCREADVISPTRCSCAAKRFGPCPGCG